MTTNNYISSIFSHMSSCILVCFHFTKYVLTICNFFHGMLFVVIEITYEFELTIAYCWLENHHHYTDYLYLLSYGLIFEDFNTVFGRSLRGAMVSAFGC